MNRNVLMPSPFGELYDYSKRAYDLIKEIDWLLDIGRHYNKWYPENSLCSLGLELEICKKHIVSIRDKNGIPFFKVITDFDEAIFSGARVPTYDNALFMEMQEEQRELIDFYNVRSEGLQMPRIIYRIG